MTEKVSTSQKRIAEMMKIFNITQSDIVRKTKIQKGTLSNYLNGKRTPDQEHLSILADPYGINPAWLMGYDVPMELRHDYTDAKDEIFIEIQKRGLSEERIKSVMHFVDLFLKLPPDKQKAIENLLE